MKNEDSNLFELAAKATEAQSKIGESLAPIMEQQARLNSIINPLPHTISPLSPNMQYCSPQVSALAQLALNNIQFQASSPAMNLAKQINQMQSSALANSIRNALNGFNAIAEAATKVVRSPLIDWLRSIDYSPIINVLRSLQQFPDITLKYRELNELYLKTMYETKWFPYAGWIADITLFHEVNDIINTSRGASKNREKRIDKAILSYYTEGEIRRLRKAWWKNTEIAYSLRKALCQALDAFLRGEYVLTISCLSTMWEGLIYIKANNAPMEERRRQKMEKTKEELKSLVEHNDFKQIFSDYFNDFIVSNCNAVEDVVEGVPNRHGVAHSWYKKYPNKKAALNAILLTDFIINLEPIEHTEENQND